MNTASQAIKTTRKAIRWLLWAREESNLRDRDCRMESLLGKENLTSRDVFEADFGTINPNGLDILHTPQQLCRFASLEQSEDYKRRLPDEQAKMMATVGGQAGQDEKIFLNPSLFRKDVRAENPRYYSDTVSHEHVHRMQGDENKLGWQSIFSNYNMRFINLGPRENGWVGFGKRLVNEFYKSTADALASREAKGMGNVSNYFSLEPEVQARLHEILVSGYAGWQKMPATKTELWAALNNMGMKMPSSITDELRSTAEGQKALDDFRASPPLRFSCRRAVKHLNYLHHYMAFDEKREVMWRQAMPMMYGSLLELYGDGPGRARMDMGENPYYAKRLLAKLINDPALPDEELAAYVDAVSPAHADQLVAALEQQIALEYNEEDPARRAIDTVFARKELKDALLSSDKIHISGPQVGMPAWWNAVTTDRSKLLATYMEAGLDPTQTVRLIDPHGDVVTEVNLATMAKMAGETKKRVDNAENNFMNVLRGVFNLSDPCNQKEIQTMKNIQRSLQVIADHSKEPDARIEFRVDGNTQSYSIHELVAIAGGAEQKPPSVLADTVHVSETAHI